MLDDSDLYAPASARVMLEENRGMKFILEVWGQDYKEKLKLDSKKSQTHRAKQYEVTSFLITDCELSTETCSKNVFNLGPLVSTVERSFLDMNAQNDQTDLRRGVIDELLRDIQQAFAPGDRESARLLGKQLESEHIATLQAPQLEFTETGNQQDYWQNSCSQNTSQPYKRYNWSSQSMEGCHLQHSRPITHSYR